LQIQKQKRLVRNAQIDVIKKQEQYEKGMLDSTFLNNAIITKNIVQNTLITLKSNRFEALKVFEALSDYDYKNIPLPNFKLISKDEFIKKHIDIKMLDFVSKKAKYAKKLTLSSYLPAIYVNGSYNNLDEDINNKSTKDEYFKYGLSASMLIFDVNVFRDIEKSKLSYLKSKLEVEDKKQEQQKAWEDIAFRIEMLNERKEIAKENFEFYKKLLKITEDDFKIGQKTSLDVELMRNSKLNALSDLKIYDISIQLELLNLYAKMSDEI
jgi:outer membrane protein TolC